MVQIVVLDKLDYCASMNNLASVKDKPNFNFVKGDIQSMVCAWKTVHGG